MLSVLSMRLSAEQGALLNRLARETGRSESFSVKRAPNAFLADRAHYLLAIAAIDRDEPHGSTVELRRELGP